MEEYIKKFYSSSALEIIKTPLPYSSIRFNSLKISSEEALKDLSEKYPNLEISIHEILYDTVIVKTLGPFQVSPVELEVYVDFKCGEAILRGSHVYSPGILGSNFSFSQQDTVSVYAVKNERPRGFKAAIENSDAKVFVGNGVMQESRKRILNTNKGLAILMTETKYSMPSFDCLDPGLYYPQNIGSISVGHILNPSPHSNVLDMCAAPGGKTSHLMTLMQNTGKLTALDKSSSRLSTLKKHLQSWGATSITVKKMDSTQAYKFFGDNIFDKVLLDAPCSGLGQRPRLNFDHLDLTKISSYQRSLLISATRVLKVGGQLLYSTCSITEEGKFHTENQQNALWAIQNLPLQIIQQPFYIGDRTDPDNKSQLFSILQHSGFFISLFIKTCQSSQP